MKTELGIRLSGVRALGAQFFFFLCFVLASQAVVYASGKQEGNAGLQEGKVLLRSDPVERPEWLDKVPQSAAEFYFVGTSQPFDTASNARDNSRENARNQVLKFYGEFIESRAIARSSISGSARDTLDAFVNREDEIKSYAEHVVSQVGTDRYYTEVYLNSDNKEEYVVYTLCQVNRKKAEDDIANFAKNISSRYAAMITPKTTVKATLEGYVLAVKALDQNPLHRITAYHEVSGKQVGLYGHVLSSIHELANSVSLEPIPRGKIQETERLDAFVRLRSTMIASTGLLNCQASLFGAGDDIRLPFSTSSDDPFNLEVGNLKAGSYRVQIDILLAELTGGIAKNTGGSFSFDVTALNEYAKSAEAMEAAVKKAVDALAGGLKEPTETRIGPFLYTGADAPSELSYYLDERVRHYAVNNRDKKFRIAAGETNGGVLAGFFTRRNDRVDVTLTLSTQNGKGDGSQIFSLSAAELERWNISVEPENLQKLEDLKKALAALEAKANAIHIQARFNSEKMTYNHCDELNMTVQAERDCYFKVIHIDVNNQMKMVFPTRNNPNNFLRANESRTIFETGKNGYLLYAPYGEETIIVVASRERFKDIEREYNAPWIPVTEERIREALRGDGETRYKITVRKPHEEYEFKKPENMTAAYQTIRDDATAQGGSFTGDETSGVYIINNIRGSYYAPPNSGTIQFATYFLDNYTRGPGKAIMTRGSNFSFSFARPVNINQAVQAVRSGIEGKGGVFTGNEEQGSFRASGITGQYQISDVVNVVITDKPMVIPNSLIEKEVRNYFGGR